MLDPRKALEEGDQTLENIASAVLQTDRHEEKPENEKGCGPFTN